MGSEKETIVDGGVGRLGIFGVTVDRIGGERFRFEDTKHELVNYPHQYFSGNLYFANAFTIEVFIEVFRLESSDRLVILRLPHAENVSLAVNPVRRLLYWADAGSSPRIASAWLDGSHNTTLVNTGISRPTALAVNHASGDVF